MNSPHTRSAHCPPRGYQSAGDGPARTELNHPADTNRILVWDWPVRLGHWLLVSCFIVAWLSAESEALRLIHVIAGGTFAGVLSFRLLWGLIGTRYARFTDFVRGPRAVVGYLRDLAGARRQHPVGHNPAGGWAILGLITLGLLTTASGWLAYQDWAGEVAEEGHEVFSHLMLALVGVHLLGVAVGSWAHGENLVRTMLSGLKRGPAVAAIPAARAWAIPLLLGWAAAVAYVLSR